MLVKIVVLHEIYTVTSDLKKSKKLSDKMELAFAQLAE